MIPRGNPPASFSQLQRPLIPFQSSIRGPELPHRSLGVYVNTHHWGTTDFLHPRRHLDSLNFCSNHTVDNNNNNNDFFFHRFLLLSRRANYLLRSMTFVSFVTVSKFLQAAVWMVTSFPTAPECSPRVLVILFVCFLLSASHCIFFFKSKEKHLSHQP